MKQTLSNILVEQYSTHPVYLAVNPFRTFAMERAEELNRQEAEVMYADLEANGWDQNIVAPYPKGGNFFLKLGRYQLCQAITIWTKPTRNPNEPCIVRKDNERLERYIEECRNMAADQYDAFTLKLVKKIGDCNSASIDGNHVWTESYLTINKPTTVEIWKTKAILNHSKYGKPFNQWPSRKMKT